MQHEHLYRLAVEQVADYAIFIIDPHGRVASWNAGVRHVLRWDESEWLGQPFSVIFTADDAAKGIPEAELTKAAETGCAEDDRWHVRKDGTQFWASGITTALRGESGNLSGFLNVMRDLTEGKRAEVRQATQLAVTTVLAETADFAQAVPRLLQAVCDASGWQWGALWRVDRAEGVLRLVDLWNVLSHRLSEFEGLSRSMTFARGVGLPGRVWASGEPAWVTDVSRDENFPRREVAVRAGLRGGFCFPVTWRGEVLAVMEFFSSEVRTPDEALLGMMTVVGGQIGQFIARKLTEDRLRAEEARHAASVQASLDCIVSMDHQGKVTEWNLAAQQTFGYARNEALGREMASLIIPPSLRQAHREGLSRYLTTGEGPVLGRRFEIAAVRKDGTEFPVELTIIRLPAEGPPAFTGYIRDITEQKRAEAEIGRAKGEAERSLAQWRAVVESMTEGLVLSDAEGNLLSMNPAALAIHEFASVEEMLKRLSDYPDLFELHDMDGQFLPVHGWPISRVMRGERFSGFEVQVYRRDTGKRWVGSYGGTPVRDDSGRVILAVLTLRDVTEQKSAEASIAASEAKFRQLAETIPQLAWMAKPDGWIFWYNRRWYEYTGTTPQQMEGWGWQSVHDPAELPRVVERWQHSIRTGEPFEMEFPLKAADGRFRWFLTRVAPLRDGDGNISLWFGTNTDIQDRRQIAEERAQLLEAERAARVEAEHASRMKDEFLATLSHELRTPLNAILGWAQVLRASATDGEDLREGLAVIERNARAQTKIIEDLLDMSRIISGKVRLDVQRLDLAAVVQAAVETVRPAAEAKGVRLQAVLDSLARPVSGDPNRLQQVFWNLLTNAVKFTPRGGRIQVLLVRVNSHLEVSVIDTGEGIKPEFLPFVFDRFRQSDASTTRRHGGLGLGLSIVKQLVELHGGTVRVKSGGQGQGATFTVDLPLTVIHPDPQTEPVRDHAEAAAPQDRAGMDKCPHLGGVKVLVVDDEADARALIKRVLEDCDAKVRIAGSAAEALKLIQAERPDVLVSDIGMPEEDGYSLIRQVRALGLDRGNVPAVALTAYARSEDRTRSVLAGYQIHVSKPVEPSELIAVVASLAGRTGEPRNTTSPVPRFQ